MTRRALILLLLSLPAPAAAATIEGRDMGGGNLLCGPGSAAAGSLPCAPNDVLSGVFTNVGLFQINAGTTVFVTPSIPLIVFASTISIHGILNGSGRGEVGGIGGDPGQPGGNGAGRGPGIGAYTEMGGGGGAYGGNGGDGSGTDGILGVGGAAYDNTSLPVSTSSVYPGSGGGGGGGSGTQTGGSGGQGGASIYLEASSFTLTGTVFARGVPGGNSTRPADAGGGGAGGGLLLRCPGSASVAGTINASGGKGGDAIAGGVDVPYPGGGGGGGRVKIYYRQAVLSASISVAGGAKGVKSANGPEGVPNAEPGAPGTISYGIVAAPPAALTFQDVSSTAIAWSWAASPDWGDASAGSRSYRIYSGTVGYHTPDRQPQLTAPEGAGSAVEPGLTPNTAYTRYVTAFTDHSDSEPSNSVSTYTLAGLPSFDAGAFSDVTYSAMRLNWGAGAPANPGYTTYEVSRSTALNFAVNVSTSYVTALSSAPAGLTPNTTYYFRVRAVNLAGLPTGFTAIVSTATMAVEPAGPSFSEVDSAGFAFNWSIAGNPPLTRYIAEISTDNFATLSRSSGTLNAWAAYSGLTVNTLYYARVKAQNHNGLDTAFTAPVTTFTAAGEPLNTAVPFTNVSAGALTFNWESGGNGAGTGYNPELSVNSDFSAPVSSDVTANLNYVFGGLSVNATYYARVRAIAAGGGVTAYTGVVSTVTSVVAPIVPASPFSGFSPVGFIFSWDEGANPPGTRYAAEISRDSFETLLASASTLAASAAFAGLSPNTVYQARAKASNFLGVDGPYSSPIRSTATLAAVPVNAAQSFTAVSAGTMTFNWAGGGNPGGTSYAAELSSSAFEPGTAVSSAATPALSQTFGGLLANTTYYARVRAVNLDNIPSAYAPAVTEVTLPLPPVLAEPAFSGVGSSALTLGWTANGNPPNTAYVAEVSRDGFVSVAGAVQTAALSASFSGLEANAVYQARVRAFNFGGVPGQYSSPIVSTATAISAPVNIAVPFPGVSAGGLTFAWGDASNAAGTSYNPEISTSSNFSAPVSSAVTANLDHSFTGLPANTTCYARVRAIGAGGGLTPYAAAVSTVTYAAAPGAAALPFTALGIAGFTFSWSGGGNPPGTLYAAEISRNSFAAIVSSAATLAESAAFGGLAPNTVYQARVKAVNFLGVDGPYSAPILSTATLAAVPLNAEQPFTAVSAAAFTFTWADGGNPGGTSYAAEISSSGFAAGTAISSAATLALSQTFGGLLANTTYYARVRAMNMDNVMSAYAPVVTEVTMPLAPALASPPFSGVGSSGLTLGWAANGNPQNTAYVAELSADNFVSIQLSSATLGAAAIFTGLTPNTTYTARVKALNYSGSAGPYAQPVVSTATLAVPPQPAVVPVALTEDGLAVQWAAGGNPGGTRFEAEVSTRPDFSARWSSSAVTGVSDSFALAPNTTYYARVRARNHNGVPTADLELGSGLTYAASPAVLESTSTGLVSVTTFSFTSTVSTGTGGLLFYRALWDRNPTHAWNDQEPLWSGLTVLTATATGNGYWRLHLRSYNFNGLGYRTADIGPFQVALSTVLPPGQPVPVPGAFTATSGITWNWPPAIAFGDTAISTYVVSIGTTPSDFSVLAEYPAGPLPSFTLDPAANGRTYYLKARAIDEGGALSQYSPVSSPGVLVDRTAPARLGPVQADRKFSYDSAILFSWPASTDAESGIKDYLLDLGTTPDGNDIYNAKNIGLQLSYQATSLPSGKAVFARVRAENNAGGISDYSDRGPGVPVWTLDQAPPMSEPYNWPNPFDPMRGPTQIGFYLSAPAKVVLKIFTLEGNLVYEESRAEGSAGNKVWRWAGRNGTGTMAAPGGYIGMLEKKYGGRTERQKFKIAVLY